MKKIYFLLLALCLFSSVNAQIINFPDPVFKATLLSANTSNQIAGGIKIDLNNNNEIEVSEALNVLHFDIFYKNISSLEGIQYFTNINYIDCGTNNLVSLDLSNNHLLTVINCQSNQLSSLNVSGLTNLVGLECDANNLTTLDLTGLTALKAIQCGNNKISNLNLNDLINLVNLTCYENKLVTLDVSNLLKLETIFCNNNLLSSLNVNSSLLDFLNCRNNNLTSLNLTSCTNIYELYVDHNNLSSILFPPNASIGYLNIQNNNFNGIDLSNVYLGYNFYFGNNPDDRVIFQKNIKLWGISYTSSTAKSLDLSNLYDFYHDTPGTNTEANFLINAPQLESINLKNGHDFNIKCHIENEGGMLINVCENPFILELNNCPNLKFICVDEGELSNIQGQINKLNLQNQIQVNTYCSFTPGGTYYTIQGNSKIDNNNNGCDVLDIVYPNLKFNITDGAISGSLISNTTGNYSIPVQKGTHTLTPVFENPSYFNVSPTNVVVNFPAQASPFSQNFCVTANGVHPDLEVTLLPIIAARPGFDAKYKIIYKNKANTTQSGTVNLTYDDSVLDLVAANPATSNQSINNLSWDFTNLLPFETREILVTLNVNSPLETPAVNNGYVLNYTASITSVATDDLPNDNTFAYNQTVVNSFDPNDISCLEGATVTTAKVGDYVHYMIRFENNGTANAQNIVVKNMVDLAKYDINSIVPIKGSHSFVTNITAGNKVEFIFENINLPFDDVNNDGYVSFKIKIKSTLAAGDTFSKNASIYFDYNFPIVTNTATTTIQTLGIKDFEFSSYFSLFPNPAATILNISYKADIEISSISIYNTLGQIVLVIPNAQNTKTIDVSGLKTGTYFIKINSDKGSSNSKFIKE